MTADPPPARRTSPSEPKSGAQTTPPAARRGPQVFRADDPALIELTAAPEPELPPRAGRSGPSDGPPVGVTTAVSGVSGRTTANTLLESGFRWGLLLISALASAGAIAVGLWFWRFISVGLERDDAIGMMIRGLLGVAAFAAVVMLVHEIQGWRRLSRLGQLRRDVTTAIASHDDRAERRIADRILALYRNRPELSWAIDRTKARRADVLDPAALLILVERDVLAPLDITARRQITTSGKRVATVTALSPMASIAFAFIVFENLRLLRRLATLYGGRPGVVGGLRLARSVIGNLIAAGGLALTDDLLGQFIGQDVLRRLSRRLGEGAFNGALTARIGVAAIAAVRPLPFLEATPIRVRDILSEVVRPTREPVG